MDPESALIAAGGSLLSGLLGSSSANKALDAQNALNERNIAEQEKFATQGIRWREADATAGEKDYGINRLVAMGAPTSSFSNVVGSFPGDNSMGQGIEKAAQAFAGVNTRTDKLKEKLLEAQIANVNSDTVKNQAAASKVATAAPTTPPPLWQDYSDGHGGVIRLPSTKASSSMQNWASLPAQMSVAASEAGNALQYEYHKLADPIVSWVKTHGAAPVRGEALRAVQPYGVSFPWN